MVALGQWTYTINEIQIDQGFEHLLNVDSISGGDGTDIVSLKFDDYYSQKAIYFSEASLSSIETVDFDGAPYYLNLIITFLHGIRLITGICMAERVRLII